MKKNGLDLFSHLAHFLGECVQLIFWFTANATLNGNMNTYSLYANVYQNGILSALHICLYPDIRTHVKRMLGGCSAMSIGIGLVVLLVNLQYVFGVV